MKITSTAVNAPSRKLSATWNQQKPLELDKETQDYLLTEAMGKFMLQNHGTCVEFYHGDLDEVAVWCKEHVSSLYKWSDDEVLMSKEQLIEESIRATEGKYSENFHENLMVKALARLNKKKSAEAKGISIPKLYFWFEDPQEAMLFKLTWGGL